MNKEKSKQNFDETERLYVEMIKKNQSEKEATQEKLQNEIKRSSELHGCLSKAQNNLEALKCEKDMMILERTEMQQSIKSIEVEKDNLKTQCEELERQISSLSDDKHNANAELVQIRINMQKAKTELEKTIEDLNKRTKNLEKANLDILHMKEEIAVRSENVERLQSELEESKDQEKSLKEEIDLLKKQLEDESGENKQVMEKTTSLLSENKSLQKEINKLNKENEKIKKKEADFKSKWDDAKKEIKDLKLAKADIEDRLREESDKVEEIQSRETSSKEELHEKLKENESVLKQSEEKILALESQLKEKCENEKKCDKQVEDLKAEAEKAKKDFIAVDKRCETEIAQMTKVLADYKKKYDELFASKDKEHENLQEEFKALQQQNSKCNEEKNDMLHQSKVDIEKMSVELQTVKQDSEECREKIGLLEKELKEKDEEISSLKQVNAELETKKADELAELNMQIEQMKIVKTACPATPKLQNNKSGITAKKNICTTPNVNKTPIRKISSKDNYRTPKQAPRRPTSAESPYVRDCHVKQTPSSNHSILKSANSQSAKKRRVMFASCARGNNNSDGESDSDTSSASEAAMEIEIDEIEKRLKTPMAKSAITPVRVKPSPMIRMATKSPSLGSKTPLKPVQRGLSLTKNKSEKQQTSLKSDAVNSKTHCHEKMKSTNLDKKIKVMPTKAQANIRKGPSRAGGKFFSASPKDSKLKALRQQKTAEDLAWFESDSIFGFGPED